MVHCNEDINYLHRVELALRESGIATNISVLQHTRVPLVKFRHVVHVPFSLSNLLENRHRCGYQLQSRVFSPHIRIRATSDRSLSLPPKHGSDIEIPSFATWNERHVYRRRWFLHDHSALLSLRAMEHSVRSDRVFYYYCREGTDRGGLGSHLIQFLYFFGLLFNFDKLTLRVKNDGCFLSKMDRGWFDSSTPWHLSVENPIDPSLDVGKASYHIKVGLNGAIQRSNSARSARTDSSL